MNAQAINSALRKHKFKDQEKIRDYMLTRGDMMKLRNLNHFLTSFSIYSTTLGGNRFVTSSIVLPIMRSIASLLKVLDDDPSYMANLKGIVSRDFKARCLKNTNQGFLMKATALDPRFLTLKVKN